MIHGYTSIEILLVEDNPGDVRLTQESLKEAKIANKLSVVGDGEEAISFLRKKGKYTESPRPDIILLDINLPKKGGLEVLEEIKEDPDLRRIPVVVLTTSSADYDILKAYNLHANCYITKPVSLDQFNATIRSLEHFWFLVVKLPPN